MATTETVKALFDHYNFHKALIIDDAFDGHPDYDHIVVAGPSAVGDEIEKLPDGSKARLTATLAREDLRQDDWEAGLANPAFLAELWQLKSEDALPKDIDDVVFGIYTAETEQKLKQLEPLQALLKEALQLTVEEVGRGNRELPANTKVVFLDLFLGVTGQAAAREEAADLIKALLADTKDRERPIVILMSTETGEGLEAWADDLRSRAALLGAKFRVISKAEFETDGPLIEVLDELLGPLDKSQALAGLLDEWDDALAKVRSDIMSDLRNLDLSDCAYLQRYRLETEGMPLGAYLFEAYGDMLRYRLEGCLPLLNAATAVNGLNFDAMPPAHFLPSEGVSLLTHAMSFVNESAVANQGHQFPSAASVLELGDVIVAMPSDWKDDGDLTLADGTAVSCVISQACDLQQDKSDAVLLLQGSLRARTWDDSIKPVETRVDCFRFRGGDYVIEWDKVKLDAWQKPLAARRLKPGGPYLRIARLRSLPALKAQQIFASNLTRVGTLASPHMVFPVGIKVVAKLQGGETRVLLDLSSDGQVARIVKGLEGRNETEYLVLKKSFGARLGAALFAAVEDFHPALRESVTAFANSRVELARLRSPCKIGRKIEYRELKIDVRRGDLQSYSQNVTIVAAPPTAAQPKALAQAAK